MNTITQKIEKKDYKKYNFLAPLLNIKQCPSVLYYRGEIPEKSNDTKVLCVIGTRSPTKYGKDCIDLLLRGLVGENIIIISGLAIGIDTLSHRNAIENKLLTVAFPGSGVNDDVIYPQSNKHFAKEILANNGAIISEFDPDSKSQIYSFAARNRILAALADLVLIIEAKEKSGTQITARLALEYGTDIAIVPGSIFSQYSKGTINLWYNGAMPVSSPDDIKNMLGINITEQGVLPLNLSPDEQLLLSLLDCPKYKEEIIEESGLSFGQVLVTLSQLEGKGIIKDNFGEIIRI